MYDKGLLPGTTTTECVTSCKTAKTQFAAVIQGACYCYNDAIPNNFGTDRCTVPCLQNILGAFCGGINAVSVFRTVITSANEPLPSIPGPTGSRYIGCYDGFAYLELVTAASIIPILPQAYIKSYGTTASSTDKITVEKCVALCASKQYTYSTPWEDTCYCADIAPLPINRVGPGHCTANACRGNTAETCGGRNDKNTIPLHFRMLDVYGPATTIAATSKPPTVGSAASDEFTIRGCYYGGLYLLDSIVSGATIAGPTDSTTCVKSCLSSASSYTYAMTLGDSCYCNNHGPTSDLLVTDQSKCNQACSKTATERCGGFDTSVSTSTGSALISVYGKVSLVSGSLRLIGFSHARNCALSYFSFGARSKLK